MRLEPASEPANGFFRRHYHWIVAAVIFLEFMITMGLTNNVFSLYLIPITKSLGVSRGAFSIAPSIKYLAGFGSNLVFGLFYNRYGYRKLTTVALVSGALAYFCFGSMTNLIPYYCGAAVLGMAEAFFGIAGCSRVITNWFHRHQGVVLGIVMASSGLGASAISIGMTAVMQSSSWRNAFRLSGGLLLVTAVLVSLMVRSKPEDVGLEAYGEAHEGKAAREKRARKVLDWEGIPLAILKKRGYFWAILVVCFLTGIVNYGIYPNIVAHVQDNGMTPEDAALVQSAMFIAMAAAKIIAGAISDRIGAKKTLVLFMVLNTMGLMLLTGNFSRILTLVGVVVFAAGLAIPSVLIPIIATELFGRHDQSVTIGFLLAMNSLSGVIASPIINVTHDWLDTYIPAFFVVTLLSVATLMVFWLAACAAERERARWLQENAE